MRGRSRLGLSIAVAALMAATIPARALVDPATPTGMVQLNGPESAVWDEATSSWYISTGGFSGSGAVVKLAPGSSTPQTFVDGLGGPQGIRIHDGTMYIADTDHVLAVSMADPGARTEIPTGGGANDVDVDPATGDLYVTDLAGNTVWRIHASVSTAFAEINSPDGVIVKDGGVYIANFALSGPGGIFRFDIATAEQTTVVDIPGATLDGLESDGADWLATDFSKGHFWRVAPDGSLTLLAQLLPGTADIGIDRETRTVAVPNLLLNFVVFLTI